MRGGRVIPGGRLNPRQMRAAMKRMGVESEEIGDVEEVVIRTATKDYVFPSAPVSAFSVQGQRIWQFVGEPIVRPRASAATAPSKLVIPDEDVKLVAERAGVSEQRARKALEECNGEPAEAIIKLMGE